MTSPEGPQRLREVIVFDHEHLRFTCERKIINGELRWDVQVSTGEKWNFLAMPGNFDVPMSVRAWVLDWWSNQAGDPRP